ncbi:MAG: ATP-binding cassette domain-containing protein [Thermodesulfobacteriota bacterium]
MLLEAIDLEFKVGKTHILRKIALGVDGGEVVGLLGRNGSGKSSILKNLIGIYRPTRGVIRLRDQDIAQWPARRRVGAGLAYSPEDTRVFPDLTVKENILLGTWVLEGMGRPPSLGIENAMDVFPALGNLLDRRGAQLSGGEKKMVSIARALALSPSLLLLDESFEGLAPLVVRHFIDAMKNIRSMGVSILLAESNLRNASLVVDRAYVLERGEIIFQGSPEQIEKDQRIMMIVGR